ncbi:MAG: toll/interleukin-1 receptor domain-containing protein [Clostridia bacterium]|nr:toll/interleukin-1 receptor domain-containing protein [Clostridia bacterium]
MTYLDRKDPEGTFAFISYSHKDEDAVKRILTALNGYGANFWYDIKLRKGQNWIEKVKEVTANKNCLGILYFLSPDFIFSKACLEEFKMGADLEKSHGNFRSAFILLDDEEPESFESFINNTRKKLIAEHIEEFEKIAEHTSRIKNDFNNDKLYCKVSKDKIDGDFFVKTIFKDVFSDWGCVSEETDKLDILMEDGVIDVNCRVKTSCRIAAGNKVSGAEWKVFSSDGKTLGAILVSDELFDATCLSLAKNSMAEINANINLPRNAEAGEARKNEKHFRFDADFLNCLVRDENGCAFRYLRSAEHEKNYIRIKEALEKVPVSDPADDGYFFVCDNQGNLMFADRGSADVYRHIHVDAYASVIPVMDIDLNKYREYVKRKKSV